MTTDERTDELGAAVADVLELDYRRSAEVEAVATSLIVKHPVTFGQLAELTIAYCLRSVEGDMDAKTIDALAKCVKTPTLWRDLFGVDVAIWVDERYWNGFDQRQREAVVMHELLHIGLNDAGKVKLLDHSIEEFGMVVATYGQWRPELERFAAQLGMFDEDQASTGEVIDKAMDEVVDRVNAGELGPNVTASRGGAKDRRPPKKATADVDEKGRTSGYQVH